MTKLTLIKTVANLSVGLSVSKVTKDIISNNTSPENLVDTAEIAVGSLVLGSMVAGQASDYVETAIDKAASFVQTMKDKRSAKTETTE
jgi:hypothetical protein